ncbi:hypothetical protein INR49_017713 [Caranx melampygus]|nr:hypothetical protein INR49_017713 [Caranx melampygus]
MLYVVQYAKCFTNKKKCQYFTCMCMLSKCIKFIVKNALNSWCHIYKDQVMRCSY